MRMQGKWIAAAAALLLSGCADSVPPWKHAPWPVEGYDVVYLGRSACYGECPVYEVEVFGDGRVRYTGEEFVKSTGVHETRIDGRAVAQLAKAVQAARFDALRRSYQDEADGCENVMTDASSLTLAVRRGGRTKSVNYYFGCEGRNIPSTRIVSLADTIDRLAGTQALVEQ
ncbi:MAG: DUF6438 domain-containing protein [Pseudomonadota bacterium]